MQTISKPSLAPLFTLSSYFASNSGLDNDRNIVIVLLSSFDGKVSPSAAQVIEMLYQLMRCFTLSTREEKMVKVFKL